MNDYVTRRRSFKIFRIASALNMPPFSMTKILLRPLGNFKIPSKTSTSN